MNNNPEKIKCSLWDNTFQENWKFEIHLKENHSEYKFEQCEQTFDTSLRLNKEEVIVRKGSGQ